MSVGNGEGRPKGGKRKGLSALDTLYDMERLAGPVVTATVQPTEQQPPIKKNPGATLTNAWSFSTRV